MRRFDKDVVWRKIKNRMLNDFSTEYFERSDDELLQLASERHSLTTEAASALDAELRRRSLTESDRVEHQRFVTRQEQREGRRRRRKSFGTLKDRMTWLDLLWALAAWALISSAYLALPKRYHMKPDWQEAAVCVMIASVVIVVASRSIFWRKIAFWMSLGISSAIQLVVVHVWTKKNPDLSRAQGRAAVFLGLVLFLAVYGLVWFLQRMSNGQQEPKNAQSKPLLP